MGLNLRPEAGLETRDSLANGRSVELALSPETNAAPTWDATIALFLLATTAIARSYSALAFTVGHATLLRLLLSGLVVH